MNLLTEINPPTADPLEIPLDKLSPDTLHAVIAEFVTREGTDYGDKVFSLEEKIAAVKRQLEEGTAKIIFNSDDETCNIVTAPDGITQY